MILNTKSEIPINGPGQKPKGMKKLKNLL